MADSNSVDLTVVRVQVPEGVLRKKTINMASQNKKRKAKNSFIMNGNEGSKFRKLKRIAYYIKADRLDAKRELRKYSA